MDKTVITWEDNEDISDKVLVAGVRAGRLLFVSGNAAYDEEERDIDRQLADTLRHQLKTLSRGGSDLQQVFKFDVYLVHPQQDAGAVLRFIRQQFPAGRLAVTVTQTCEQPRPHFLVSLVSTALVPEQGGSQVEVRTVVPQAWRAWDKPFAAAVQVGELVFVSGQMGVDPRTGALVAGGVVAQTAQALRNVAEILAAAGTSMDKVVRGTAYVVSLQQHYLAMNDEYKRAWGGNPPARAIVGVSELTEPGALVQFDFVAAL